MIYWFTGQPGSGKTTLAVELIKHLDNPIHVDGDNLRDILKNYHYTDVGRKKNIENVITIARFLDFKKYDVVISVVAPFRNLRESLKETNNVKEFYVHTKKTRGRENFFCKHYEKPETNYIDVDTTVNTVNTSIETILEILQQE
jgi:adenylylsulfate kinase